MSVPLFPISLECTDTQASFHNTGNTRRGDDPAWKDAQTPPFASRRHRPTPGPHPRLLPPSPADAIYICRFAVHPPTNALFWPSLITAADTASGDQSSRPDLIQSLDECELRGGILKFLPRVVSSTRTHNPEQGDGTARSEKKAREARRHLSPFRSACSSAAHRPWRSGHTAGPAPHSALVPCIACCASGTAAEPGPPTVSWSPRPSPRVGRGGT